MGEALARLTSSWRKSTTQTKVLKFTVNVLLYRSFESSTDTQPMCGTLTDTGLVVPLPRDIRKYVTHILANMFMNPIVMNKTEL